MLENTEGAKRIPKGQSQNGQSRETGNKRYTRRRNAKQKHNAICVGFHYTRTNTYNVNKRWTLLQTTGGNDEPSIVYMRVSGVNYIIFIC